MTLRELLAAGEEELRSVGIDDWNMDAWYLMEETLQVTRTRYLMDSGRTVSEDVSEAKELIAGGTIGGGMLPKLSNCIDAIEAGVSRVHIIDGRIPHSILMEIFSDRGVGTAILGDTEEKFYHE